MKRMVSLLAVFVIAGLLVASSAAQTPSNVSTITATVVSVAKDAKTITFKTEDDKQWTLPAEGGAIDALDEVKTGDRVELTCRDDDTGKHQAVTAIAKIKPKEETKH